MRAGLAGLALLVLAMFFDVLFVPGARVVGSESADMARMFLPWRDFGFSELAKGNLALWNPHNYAGAPFFGAMQSALLYPPNVLFLVLPAPLAANWAIALNVWLLGASLFLWALRRGLHPFAAFVAAALVMFCAPHFLRIHAGHATAMAAMAWIPLLFLALDEWLASRRPGWVLLGMLAVAMQILAGHPQTVHLTALGAGFYALVRLWSEPGRVRAAAGLLAFYAGGALLAALQLFAAFQAASEGVRSAGVPYEFAVYFSFPPENLVTWLAPAFFGDPYWGRWYLWEASAFMGVVGFVLACYGIATAQLAGKKALLATAGVAALLAFGDNTPLFRVAFDWVPWLDRFRGAGKFFFLTTLILALFAGCGLDRLLRSRAVSRRTLGTVAGAALAVGASAVLIRLIDWQPVAHAVMASGQTYLERPAYGDRAFLAAAQRFAALSLALGAAILAVVAGILLWARREPRAALLLGILAVAEIFAFARLNRPTFDASRIVFPELAQFLAAHPGDYRILNLTRYPNSAVSMRAFDAWGYDPAVTRRYAEFITWSAGGDPARAIEYVVFRQFHPLLAMLRVKYVVVEEQGSIAIHPGGTAALGRVELIGSYQVQTGRTAILRAMSERSFDPAREVILEREPTPKPLAAGTQGRATLVREGSDFLEVEADVASPSVLLVTDAWTPAWRAVSLESNDARRYEVVPANYVLRGVPLERGRHRLRLEYAPSAFPAGLAVSAIAWAAWLGAAFFLWKRSHA